MSENSIEVLLIEGDADEGGAIKKILADDSGAGRTFSVKEAARLSPGSRLLARERFDAILLDLSPAPSAGLETFRRVRAQTPEIPILILAGIKDQSIAVEAVREGAQDCFIKGSPECRLLKRAILFAVESKRLRLLEEEARENMRVFEIKNQFMGRISHELRNTLATVKTAVFCLNDRLAGELTPRQSRLVEMISRNVDRQVKIIDNVLDLARLQSGKIKIVSRSVELPQIIDEIFQEFSIKNKPQRLTLEVPAELPPVNGDADLLVQVLRNLLDNAFRYARSRVTIKVSDSGPGEVTLSVVDDGEGIPQERIGALFNQFVQFDRPKGGNGYKGTGLGLTICKGIVEAHGGRIWVESAKGEGTSFNLGLTKHFAPGSAAGAAARVLEPVVRAPADGRTGPSHRVQE